MNAVWYEQGNVTKLLEKEYAAHKHDSAILPTQLADAVYAIIDPKYQAPHYVQKLATLQLRKLAQQLCASRQRNRKTASSGG
jgi:hypothetical protein